MRNDQLQVRHHVLLGRRARERRIRKAGGKATSGKLPMSYVSPEGWLKPLRCRMSMGSRSSICIKYGRNQQRGLELDASDELRIYLLDDLGTKYST